MASIAEILKIVLIGGGATAIMDLWLLILGRIGVQTLNFAMIGRWVGHLPRRTFAHAAIGKAPAIAHEAALGWLTHYTVGIAFAALLTFFAGIDWLAAPTPGPALMTGIGTVAFPLLIMQPAMGLGVAASRTATPFRNCIRSVANHGVFGLGLFLSVCVIEWMSR